MKGIPQAVLEHHTAVLGKTGSGKTSTSKLAVEQVVAAGFRVCVLDTIKSDWWGITSSASGKKAGLAFRILGGPHGHVPLHSSAGKSIGALVGAGKLPLSIIDMADFEAGGIQRFFSDFAPALMRAAKGVIYLVIEEAHELAPKERAGFGAENMAIHWAKKLATAGRSKGIRLIVATQRVQALHNAVLGSCETIIAHRLTTPADQEPVVKWLRANTDKDTAAKVAGSLSSLATGTAWACSGEAKLFEQMAFRKFSTFDNTATPTGDGADVEVTTAPVDQEELRAIIGEAVKEAEANDPKLLRAKIAELERALREPAKVTTAGYSKSDINAEYTRGRADGFEAGMLKGRADAILDAEAAIRALPGGLDTPARRAAPSTFTPPPAYGATPLDERQRKPMQRVFDAVREKRTSTDTLPAGEMAILSACIQHQNNGGCSREQLTVLTGYKRSTRDAYIQRLRDRDYVRVEGGAIVPTGHACKTFHDVQPLPTGKALRDHWLARLPEGESRILAVLIAEYPAAVSRHTIEAKTDFKRSTRDAYIQRLKARQLVTIQGGDVCAAAELF